MKLREKLIIKEIVNKNIESTYDLSKLLQVSERTIRNDIKNINYDFKEQYGTYLCLVKNKKIYIESEVTDFYLSRNILTNDFYIYKLSVDERVIFTLLKLLENNGYVKIDDLANEFYVSRGTILSDLEKVREWCKRKEVKFLSKRSYGIKIDETVAMKHKIASQLIKDRANHDKNSLYEIDFNQYDSYFTNVNLQELKNLVIECEEEFDFFLSDIAFEGLVIHLALAIERNILNTKANTDEINPYYKEEIDISTREYQLAKYMFNKINEYFKISLPETEIENISFHNIEKDNYNDITKNKEWIIYQTKVSKFINETCDELNIKQNKRSQLSQGLVNHFFKFWERIKKRKQLMNPLKEMMFENYPEIVFIIKNKIKDIATFLGCDPSDDEIAYIVLHLAAIIEKNKKSSDVVPSVLIVCSTGKGTSMLIKNRIEELFNFKILSVLSLHMAEEYILNNHVDLIISTIQMKKVKNLVLVTPVINEEDVTKIQRKVLDLGFSLEAINSIENHSLIDLRKELSHLVIKYRKNEKCKTITDDIYKLINSIDEIKEEQLMLSDVLKLDYIRLNVEVDNWEDAVYESGKVLMDNKAVTRDYIIEAIKNVKEVGPYIVITKGVALPHASNQKGVSKTSISLTTLRNPINFGNESNDPVKYVFMLATRNGSEHIHALSELVGLLEVKDFYKCMDNAKNAIEIINFIESFENKKGGKNNEESISNV